MTHHRFALLATTAILVLSVGSAPPRARAQTIYPDQEIFWDESQGGIYALPGGANFGASLCAAQSGAGMAQAATTSAHARAQLELVGNEWTVASQSPNSEGPQLFACGHDSDGPGLVTTIKRPGPAYRALSVPSGTLQFDGITGDSVHAIARYGDLVAVGQPTRGVGGAVSFFRRDGAGQWAFERRFDGSTGAELGKSVLVLGPNLAIVGAPGRGHNGEVWIATTNPSDGSFGVLFEGPAFGTDIRFGHSLAADGPWLAVGAPLYDRLIAGGGVWENAGAVFLHKWEGFGWLHSVTMTGNTSSGMLGTRIDVKTFPGGGAMLVAGAPGELGTNGNARVYVFENESWNFRHRLTDDQGQSGDFVGLGVAIATPSRVLVGSPGKGPSSKGAVLAFRIPLFSDGFEVGTTSAWSATVP